MNKKNNKLMLMYSVMMLIFVAPVYGAGRARHNGACSAGTSRPAGQSRRANNGAHAARLNENNSAQGAWSGAENSHGAGAVESGRTKSTVSEFDMAFDVATGCAKLLGAGVMGWQTVSAFSDNRSQLNNFLVMVWATLLAGRSAYDELAYLKRKYADDRESRATSFYNDLVQLKRDFFGNHTRSSGHGVTTEKRVISLGQIIMSGVTAIHMTSEANRKFNESQAVPDRLVALCYAWCGLLASSDVYNNFKYVFEGF